MASVAAGGLFNAVAFAGAGYIFHKLDKKGYEHEMKRHNLAMELLTAAKDSGGSSVGQNKLLQLILG